MKNQITKLTKIACFALVAAALVTLPAITRAEDSTNAAATTTPKKRTSLPFHGNVASVDAAAMTFTVGTMNIAISSTTKITKDGKPAVFSDIAVGESVSGSYKKDADGKINASSVKIGEAKKTAPAPASPPPAMGK